MARSPLRIVHVLSSLEIGGAEQVVLNLAAGQVELGHVVHVVSLAPGPDGPHADAHRRMGVQVHRVSKLGPTVDPSLPIRLAWLFRRLRADIIHSHDPQPVIYAAPAARCSRVPLVHTKHGENQETPRKALLRRHASRLVSVFVAVSRQTALEAEQQGEVAVGKAVVIENGIDVGLFVPSDEARTTIRSALEIPPDAQVIGTVGRLSTVKNQPLLIRAAAPSLGPLAHLVIVGDGPHRQAVEAEVGRSGKSAFIHLLGQRTDVHRLLPAFDIFVLTSDSEGLPMAIPEAMACGLPVVSTNVGGIADVVADGETGYLVPKGNEAALRTCIERLLDDVGLVRAMGGRARTLCLSRYSSTSMRDRYLALYFETVDLARQAKCRWQPRNSC
jgi:glycosyltransferase involved in cell wall biosynthesis